MIRKDDYRLNHIAVYFYGGVYDAGCVYLVEVDANLLMKLDICNGKIEIIDSLKKRGIDCRGILKFHDKIAVTYSDKSSEMILKTSKGEWVKKEIDYCGDFENDQVYEFENNIYIFDKKFGIRKFDSEFKNIDNFMFLNDAIGIQANRITETRIGIITEDSKVIEFDLLAEKMIELELPQRINGIETICYDGESYWFTTYNWEIIKFNIFNKGIQCYQMPNELTNIANQKDKRRFEKSFYYDGKIWLIPYYASNIVQISTKNVTVTLLEEERSDSTAGKERLRRNSMQYISVFCGEGVLLLSCATQHIYYLNFKDGSMARINLHSNWRRKDISVLGVMSEGMLGIGIKQFLSVVQDE